MSVRCKCRGGEMARKIPGTTEQDGTAHDLDLRGLKCPLPVLRARKALAALPPGARLTVIATDPMAAIDIPHMCHEDGHELLETSREEREWTYRIRRGRPVAGTDPAG
eukprot:gene26980-29691_t